MQLSEQTYQDQAISDKLQSGDFPGRTSGPSLNAPAADSPSSWSASADTMPQPAATARAVFNALPRVAAPRRFLRSLSTAQGAQARRPAAPSPARPHSPPYQPWVQRRFKYKTVEEAKSRYRSGVGTLAGHPGIATSVGG